MDPDKRSAEAGGPEGFASSLGRTIKVVRTDRGQSRRELAAQAAISYSYVTEIENGRKPPSSPVLVRIAQALGLSPSELLGAAEARAAAGTSSAERSAPAQDALEQAPAQRRTWFHMQPSPGSSSPQREPVLCGESEALTGAEAERAQVESAIAKVQALMRRMSADDVERVLDLARRLAQQSRR